MPPDGDTVAVTQTAYPAANNGNALALVALRDDASASSTAARPSPTPRRQALADVGVRVQGARTAADISAARRRRCAAPCATSQVGVNLDEEAARLIQYQQSYQAAAKVLQVAQTVFDTLLRSRRSVKQR